MPEQPPSNEVNDPSSTPSVIEQFIGQRQVVQRIQVALNAAWQDGVRFPHSIMVGPPGVGKTELCHLISKEMGAEMFEQLAQNIRSIEQMRGFLMEPGDRDLAFIDEVHELHPTLQVTLYRAMENGKLFLETNNAKKKRILQMANLTLVAASTNPEKLLKPLRDRFKLVLQFDYYTNAELTVMLKQRSVKLGWQVDDTNLFDLIAQRSRGTPRIALRILEEVRRVARSQGDEILTIEHFNIACKLEGLDTLGLGHIERKYLCILAQQAEPVRLNVLASQIGLAPKTVATTIEEFLLRAGLIGKTDKGRMITGDGLRHLQDNARVEVTNG